MTTWLILAAQVAAAAPQAQPALPPIVPAPPGDWATMPLLVLPAHPHESADISSFVQAEVKAGRCKAVAADGGTWRLDSPVAVLIGPAGGVRQVVPQAIGCPTVEQYTVGYVSTLARGTTGDRASFKPGWYRLPVTYQWAG